MNLELPIPPRRARIPQRLCDLFDRLIEVAVVIEVADDGQGRLTHCLRHDFDRKLRLQVIGKGDGSGKKRFKGRLLDRLGRRTFVPRIEVVVEEGAEIDLIERIGSGLTLRCFRRQAALRTPSLRIPERLLPRVPGSRCPAQERLLPSPIASSRR